MPSDPANLAKLFELAVKHHQSGNLPEAERCYKAILRASPDQFDALHYFGLLQAQCGHAQEAVELIQRALSINPNSVEANSNLGNVLLETGRPDEAAKYARKALAIRPDNIHALYILGNALCDLHQLDDALRSYDAALAINPRFLPALNNRGNLLKELDRFEEALTSFERARAITPDEPGLLVNIGNIQRALRRDHEALMNYRKALAIKPDFAGAHNELGNTLQSQGKLDEAIANFRTAIVLQPDFAFAHNNLGSALHEQNKREEAMASYRNALGIKPDFAEAHNNLGNALRDQGRFDESVTSYHRALTFKPDYAEAHSNLGLALKDQGRLDEAIAHHRRAIAIKPDYADAHNNLALALRDQGKVDEAAVSCRLAITLKPDYIPSYNNLGVTLQDQGKLDDAITCYQKALGIEPDFAEAYSNLLFATQFSASRSPMELLAESTQFAARYEAPLMAGWRGLQNTRDPGRRLKVGYVSPDLRRHAVAFFIEPVLANHDKDRFEVFCYYNHAQHDDFTDRLAGYADRWLDCKPLTDEQLAQRIRADGVDILVDLAGHTAHNRMLTFARKPAPVQITYLGYPGTSGLSAMDYRLTDSHADPQGSDAYYTEKLLRLPDSLWCYRPEQIMPEITALPAQQNGYVTFGSFNNFNKIDSRCVELWAQLLQAMPNSKLLMVTVPEGESRHRMTEQFAAHGVAPERLAFHGKLPANEFHRMLQQADITLDPVTVNGATTTCESLWLGVPVISLVGTRFLERAGFSLLSAAGLRDFAATTPQEFIAVAVRLAENLPHLAQLRSGLRAQVAASPLADAANFTRNLEKLYRHAWTHWCSTTT